MRNPYPRQFANREACCAPGSGAFGEGCSTYIPSAPCFVIDSYDPVRRCRLENDIAKCSRGERAGRAGCVRALVCMCVEGGCGVRRLL